MAELFRFNELTAGWGRTGVWKVVSKAPGGLEEVEGGPQASSTGGSRGVLKVELASRTQGASGFGVLTTFESGVIMLPFLNIFEWYPILVDDSVTKMDS